MLDFFQVGHDNGRGTIRIGMVGCGRRAHRGRPRLASTVFSAVVGRCAFSGRNLAKGSVIERDEFTICEARKYRCERQSMALAEHVLAASPAAHDKSVLVSASRRTKPQTPGCRCS